MENGVVENAGRNGTKSTAISVRKFRPWCKAFLEGIRNTGCVTTSAALAGVARQKTYEFMERCPRFRDAFERAKDRFAESLVIEAIRRGKFGVEKPVIYQGKLMGQTVDADGNPCEPFPGARIIPLTIKEYSDPLLIRALEAKVPEFKRDKPATVNVTQNNTLTVNATIEATLDEYADVITGGRIPAKVPAPNRNGQSIHSQGQEAPSPPG